MDANLNDKHETLSDYELIRAVKYAEQEYYAKEMSKIINEFKYGE